MCIFLWFGYRDVTCWHLTGGRTAHLDSPSAHHMNTRLNQSARASKLHAYAWHTSKPACSARTKQDYPLMHRVVQTSGDQKDRWETWDRRGCQEGCSCTSRNRGGHGFYRERWKLIDAWKGLRERVRGLVAILCSMIGMYRLWNEALCALTSSLAFWRRRRRACGKKHTVRII